MSRRFYWLKLPKDFFKDKWIKKLRRLPGGSDYTVIYMKMLLLTVDTDGVFNYEGVEENFWSEIAFEIDEDKDAVAVTCQFLERAGLLVVSKDGSEINLPAVAMMTGSEDASASRVRRFRENQKAQRALSDCQSGVSALHCNGEIEKEKELELEKEIELETDLSDKMTLGSDEPCSQKRTQYQNFVDSWNSLSEFGIVQIRSISGKRADALRARLRQYGDDSFNECVEAIRQSDFLQGRNNRGWVVTFDWLVKPSNYPKVLEGNYRNKVKVEAQPETDYAAQMQGW